jgi:hypothetical protein
VEYQHRKTVILTEQIAYIKTSEIDSRDKDIILNDGTTIVLKNLNFKNLLEMLPSKILHRSIKKRSLHYLPLRYWEPTKLLLLFLLKMIISLKLRLVMLTKVH